MTKTIEEITQFFVDKLPEPLYIKKGTELYVIKGFKNRNDVPIVDDGSIVGVKYACLNFFPFSRRSKKKSPSEWLFNDYIAWLPANTVLCDYPELDERLRQYYSYSFVLWLMEKYPDIEIHDAHGKRIKLPNPRVRY